MVTATDSDMEGEKESVIAEFSFTLGGALPDLTLTAAEVSFGVDAVFPNADGEVTYTAQIGDGTAFELIPVDNKATIDGDLLQEGENTIMITAIDSASTPVTMTDDFVVTLDKSPTVANEIEPISLQTDAADTTLDLSDVFGGGTGALTYAINMVAGVSLGTDNKVTFDHTEADLLGKSTIMITATDSDTEGDTESVIEEVEFTLRGHVVDISTVGADVAVDLSAADLFPDATGDVTYTAQIGSAAAIDASDGIVTLLGNSLVQGDNMITIAAIDSASTPVTVTDEFVVTIDKSPTVATVIEPISVLADAADITVDLADVFGGGTRWS